MNIEGTEIISNLIVGIDATNIRRGGGLTHLIEILDAVNPQAHGITRVFVWAGNQTLSALAHKSWLVKENSPPLNGGLLRRTLWQRFSLSAAVRAAGCDVLFVPGGSYSGSYHPVVTMSQNMLPFEWRELRRFGWSLTTLKLIVLRLTQAHSFRAADGVIFLTDYAKQGVGEVVGPLRGEIATIPHGLSSRFSMSPRQQRPIVACSAAEPYRLLYISIIDQYKHQWQVVEAVAQLRQTTGWPLTLDLVGPAYPPALRRLQTSLQRYDPDGQWVHYHGAVPYSELHIMYARADLGVFASSCENMPNILLETMAAGLSVACTNRGPMPEILGDAGVYFDPEHPVEIARSLQRLIESTDLRAGLAQASFAAAQKFTWERCAEQTFSFLVDVCRRYQKQSAKCVA